MDLREYWDIIVKRRKLIAVVFLVTVLGVAVYSFTSTPIYEASTTLIVRDTGATMQSMLFEGMSGVGSSSTTQNYIQIMKSRSILGQVRSQVGMEEVGFSSLDKMLTIQPVQGTDVLKDKYAISRS